MQNSLNEWKHLFSAGNGPRVLVLAGGISLHAVNIFVGATLMPSVVRDIGGVELLAWNTTLYILASIFASVFVAHRPTRLRPCDIYIMGALAFAVGSLICGVSLRMTVMLVGRFFQGFGAGILVAISYSMIRILFPQSLWPKALALMSVVWGSATLLGPTIGGFMAAANLWRLSFLMFLPAAFLLAVLARSTLPTSFTDRMRGQVPMFQIVLLSMSILSLSIAGSMAGDRTVFAGIFVGLGLICATAMVWCENTRSARLFPKGSFSLTSPLFILYVTTILIYACQASEIYVPYFLQVLKNQRPLSAGYMVSTIAVGWTLGAIFSAGFRGSKARLAIVVGPFATFLAFLGLWVFLPTQRFDDDRAVVAAIAVCLSMVGVGIGLCWPHIQSETLARAPPGEADLTSASIPIIQQFASALGAAVAGLIVNFNGLSDTVDFERVSSAASSLFLTVSFVAVLIFPLAIMVARAMHTRTAVPDSPISLENA